MCTPKIVRLFFIAAATKQYCETHKPPLPVSAPDEELRPRSLISFRMSQSELACVYAALILHDDGLEISADNIQKLTSAANCKVEPYWPGLFAKLFANKNMDDLITNVGAGGGGPVTSGGGGGGGAAAEAGGAAEEKKEEKEEEAEESDEDMGFSLFD